MLPHLDASEHRWFQDERWHELIAVMDDATNELAAAEPGHAFVKAVGRNLDRTFSVQHERTVNRDNTVSADKRVLQIEKSRWRGTLAGCRVIVCEHLDGRMSILYGPHVVEHYDAHGQSCQGCAA